LATEDTEDRGQKTDERGQKTESLHQMEKAKLQCKIQSEVKADFCLTGIAVLSVVSVYKIGGYP